MNKSTFFAILVCCAPIVGALLLSWSDHFAHADTVESDINGGRAMTKMCTVLHGNRILEVPDKKTLTIKDGVVTFIDVNGNQLWVSQPFIVTVPDQAERRFEQN